MIRSKARPQSLISGLRQRAASITLLPAISLVLVVLIAVPSAGAQTFAVLHL